MSNLIRSYAVTEDDCLGLASRVSHYSGSRRHFDMVLDLS
jgi:hypothetical protein